MPNLICRTLPHTAMHYFPILCCKNHTWIHKLVLVNLESNFGLNVSVSLIKSRSTRLSNIKKDSRTNKLAKTVISDTSVSVGRKKTFSVSVMVQRVPNFHHITLNNSHIQKSSLASSTLSTNFCNLQSLCPVVEWSHFFTLLISENNTKIQ